MTSASDSFHNSLLYSQSALIKLPVNYYYTSSVALSNNSNVTFNLTTTYLPVMSGDRNLNETVSSTTSASISSHLSSSSSLSPVSPSSSYSHIQYQTNRIYQQGSTLAMVSFITTSKELTYCVIYDIDKDRDKVVLLFKLYYNSIFYINIDDMIRLIDTCRDIDIKRNPSLYHPPSVSISTSASSRSFSSQSSASRSDSSTTSLSGIMMNNFTEIWTGMVPGTKWCGLGDSASHYFDLGSKGIVDSCCRAHDLCPIRLRPFRKDYGLGYNFSIYTKSYCTCDDSFYHCLKSTNSTMADMIGNFYFNFMKFGCIEPVTTTTNDKNISSNKSSTGISINRIGKVNGNYFRTHVQPILSSSSSPSSSSSSSSSFLSPSSSSSSSSYTTSTSSPVRSRISNGKKSKSISNEVKLRVNYTRNLRY